MAETLAGKAKVEIEVIGARNAGTIFEDVSGKLKFARDRSKDFSKEQQVSVKATDAATGAVTEYTKTLDAAADAVGVTTDALNKNLQKSEKLRVKQEEQEKQQKENTKANKRGGISLLELNAGLELAKKAYGGLAKFAKLAFKAQEMFFGGYKRLDKLEEFSTRTGTSVKLLSQLDLASRTAGVGMAGMALATNQLSRFMYLASQGVKNQQRAFKDLGIDVTDATGRLKPATDVLLEMSEIMPTIENATERTSLALSVMGRRGADMMSVMMGGAEGLRRSFELNRKLGLEASRFQAEIADAIDNNMVILSSVLDGVQNQLAIGFTPAIRELTDEIVFMLEDLNLADGSVQKLGASVGRFIRDWLDPLVQSFRNIVKESPFEELEGGVIAFTDNFKDEVGKFGDALLVAMKVLFVKAGMGAWDAFWAGWGLASSGGVQSFTDRIEEQLETIDTAGWAAHLAVPTDELEQSISEIDSRLATLALTGKGLDFFGLFTIPESDENLQRLDKAKEKLLSDREALADAISAREATPGTSKYTEEAKALEEVRQKHKEVIDAKYDEKTLNDAAIIGLQNLGDAMSANQKAELEAYHQRNDELEAQINQQSRLMKHEVSLARFRSTMEDKFDPEKHAAVQSEAWKEAAAGFAAQVKRFRELEERYNAAGREGELFTAVQEEQVRKITDVSVALEKEIEVRERGLALGLSARELDEQVAQATDEMNARKILQIELDRDLKDIEVDRIAKLIEHMRAQRVLRRALDETTAAYAAAGAARKAVEDAQNKAAKAQATLNLWTKAKKDSLSYVDALRSVAAGLAHIEATEKKLKGAERDRYVAAEMAAYDVNVKIQEIKNSWKEAGKEAEQSFLGLGPIADDVKSAFGQVFDALIEGTLDFGETFKSMGLAIGKNLFEGVLNEKLSFDTEFKGNILDLGEMVIDELGDAFSQVFGDAGDGAKEVGAEVGGVGAQPAGATAVVEAAGRSAQADKLSAAAGAAMGGIGAGIGVSLAGLTGLGSRAAATDEPWNKGARNVAGAAPMAGMAAGVATGALAASLGPMAATGYGAIVAAIVAIILLAVGDALVHVPTKGAIASHKMDLLLSKGSEDMIPEFADISSKWGAGYDKEYIRTIMSPQSRFGTSGMEALRLSAYRGEDVQFPFGREVGSLAPGEPDTRTMSGSYRLFGPESDGWSRAAMPTDIYGGVSGFVLDQEAKGQSRMDTALYKALGQQAWFSTQKGTYEPEDYDQMRKDTLYFGLGMSAKGGTARSRGVSQGDVQEGMFPSFLAFIEAGNVTLPEMIANLELFRSQWAEMAAESVAEGYQSAATAMVDVTDQYAAGAAAIITLFDTDLPKGTKLGLTAISTMANESGLLFDEMSIDQKEAVYSMVDSFEDLGQFIARMAEAGYYLDADKFEEELFSMVSSAELVGTALADAMASGDVSKSFGDALRKTVTDSIKQGVIDALLDTTMIGQAFKPVFDVLQKVGDYDLASESGLNAFFAELEPAMASSEQEAAKLYARIEQLDKLMDVAEMRRAGFTDDEIAVTFAIRENGEEAVKYYLETLLIQKMIREVGKEATEDYLNGINAARDAAESLKAIYADTASSISSSLYNSVSDALTKSLIVGMAAGMGGATEVLDQWNSEGFFKKTMGLAIIDAIVSSVVQSAIISSGLQAQFNEAGEIIGDHIRYGIGLANIKRAKDEEENIHKTTLTHLEGIKTTALTQLDVDKEKMYRQELMDDQKRESFQNELNMLAMTLQITGEQWAAANAVLQAQRDARGSGIRSAQDDYAALEEMINAAIGLENSRHDKRTKSLSGWEDALKGLQGETKGRWEDMMDDIGVAAQLLMENMGEFGLTDLLQSIADQFDISIEDLLEKYGIVRGELDRETDPDGDNDLSRQIEQLCDLRSYVTGLGTAALGQGGTAGYVYEAGMERPEANEARSQGSASAAAAGGEVPIINVLRVDVDGSTFIDTRIKSTALADKANVQRSAV